MRYFKTIATAAAVLSFCTACAASEPAMQTKAAAAAAHTDVKTGHHNATDQTRRGAAIRPFGRRHSVGRSLLRCRADSHS